MSKLAVILKIFFSIFDKILSQKELYFFSEIGKKGKVGEKMKLQVYPDVIFLVNFSMDFLFFQIINHAVHKNAKIRRILLTAILGGLIGVFYALLDIELTKRMLFGDIISNLIKLFAAVIFFGILYVSAFGREGRREKLRSIGYFLLILFLYAGFHLLLLGNGRVSYIVLLITGFLFYFLFPVFEAVIAGMREEIKDFAEVSFEMSGTLIKGKGFIDSGNHLREPASLIPVCIVEKSYMERFLGKERIEEFFSTEVEYHSLGNAQGKLMAARLGKICIRQGRGPAECREMFLALYPGVISSDFEFLIPESYKEEK